MTETRKKIIKLIEPYMDKTLSEWCVVILNSVWQKYTEKPVKWRYATFLSEWRYLSKTKVLTANNANRRFKSSWEISEILWHYDITAVLKYIVSKWYATINFIINETDLVNWELVRWIDFIYLYKNKLTNPSWELSWNKIPNKPLHLYTKQEDENLLELLQEIWHK